jgi:hypothetical protein
MKESTLTIRVEPELRAQFNKAVKQEHRPVAQVLRDFMRTYVERARVPPPPRIDEAERQRRIDAVNYGRASVFLEGFTLSDADEQHAQRFINGEIDLREYVEARYARER